jgi:hypothetical protein
VLPDWKTLWKKKNYSNQKQSWHNDDTKMKRIQLINEKTLYISYFIYQ